MRGEGRTDGPRGVTPRHASCVGCVGGMSAAMANTQPTKTRQAKNKAGRFTAEMGLLQAFVASKATRKTPDNSASRDKATLGNKRNLLMSYRYDTATEAELEKRTVEAEVRSLPFKVTPSVPKSPGFKRLENMQAKRQQRHDRCFDRFRKGAAEVAQGLEKDTSELCEELSTNIRTTKQDLENVFQELGDGDKLASHAMDQVQDAWNDLAASGWLACSNCWLLLCRPRSRPVAPL